VEVCFNKEFFMRLLNNDEMKAVDGGAGIIFANAIRRRNTKVDISFDVCSNRDRIRYFWHNPIRCNIRPKLPPNFGNYWL
jgi:hypothetical protein